MVCASTGRVEAQSHQLKDLASKASIDTFLGRVRPSEHDPSRACGWSPTVVARETCLKPTSRQPPRRLTFHPLR